MNNPDTGSLVNYFLASQQAQRETRCETCEHWARIDHPRNRGGWGACAKFGPDLWYESIDPKMAWLGTNEPIITGPEFFCAQWQIKEAE